MIDHCISALRKRDKEEVFRIYITDVLKGIFDGYHRAHGVNSDIPRYCDLAEKKGMEEGPDSQEIINRISDKLRNMGNERI